MSKTVLEIKKFDGTQDLSVEVTYFGFDKMISRLNTNRAVAPKEVNIRIPVEKTEKIVTLHQLYLGDKILTFPEVIIKVISPGEYLVYTFSQTTINNIAVYSDPKGMFWEITFSFEKFEYRLDATAGTVK